MAVPEAPTATLRAVEEVGRGTLRGVESLGYAAVLLRDAFTWILLGRRRRQPVRAAPIAAEMMEIGIGAIPIVSVLSLTIGVMLAMQGIHALAPFGAEHQVTIGVALSVTREFAPLITGIIVAGRSGAALAARLGTMTINEEVSALKVMGVDPVRFLVVPPLVALVVMLPALALWSDLLALGGAGLFITQELDMALPAYVAQTVQFLAPADILHGVGKAAIFGVLIALVAAVNGSGASGGAAGVGRVTTQSVVQGITAIVLADMLFVFAATR
jgi:phospholipid/cholesterol/gamma-HCH transport system permease protein